MKIFFALILTFVGQMALANDFAATMGFRSNSADAVPNGYNGSSRTSLGAGVLGFFDMNEQFVLRSGFLYNQRNYRLTSGTTDTDFNMAHIDIPLTAMFKFADYGGAFLGPVVSLLASKECKVSSGAACTAKNPESMMLPIQFGVSFKFAPQMGAELYYEMLAGDVWKDSLKDSKTVGVNLMYTFE